MSKLHTQLIKTDKDQWRIRLAKHQDDPIICLGSGQVNTMTPAMWDVLKSAQDAADNLQDALDELYCSDQFPFEANDEH